MIRTLNLSFFTNNLQGEINIDWYILTKRTLPQGKEGMNMLTSISSQHLVSRMAFPLFNRLYSRTSRSNFRHKICSNQ